MNRSIIIGKIKSLNISEMAGFQFGMISVETYSGTRYELKYDRESKGEIPSVGSSVTIEYTSEPFLKIIQIQIGTFKEWVSKAKQLELDNNLTEAIVAYDEALKFKPDDILCWYTKAILHSKLDQHEQMKACHEKIIELEPNSKIRRELDKLMGGDQVELPHDKSEERTQFRIWISKAKHLELKDQLTEAIQAYDEALKIHPSDILSWLSKAKLHHRLEQSKEVETCYAKIIELNAAPDIKHQLEQIMGDQKDIRESIEISTSKDESKLHTVTKIDQSSVSELHFLTKEILDIIIDSIQAVSKEALGMDKAEQLDILTLHEKIKNIRFFDIPIEFPAQGKTIDKEIYFVHKAARFISSELKGSSYFGSIWLHQKFKYDKKPIDYSILYQGVFTDTRTVIFPSLTITAIIDKSLPKSISFQPKIKEWYADNGIMYYEGRVCTKASKKFSRAAEFSGGVFKVKHKEQPPQELINLKDAKLSSLFLGALSGYEAGVLELKLARKTGSVIMDIFADIPCCTIYKRKRKSLVKPKFKICGEPILSIVPRQGKTLVSLQLCPYFSKNGKNEATGILVKLDDNNADDEILEIGLPEKDIVSTAFMLVDRFCNLDDLPWSESEFTAEFRLWSHLILGLEIARKIYHPDQMPLSMKDIVNQSRNARPIIKKLNEEFPDITFDIPRFLPPRFLYKD